MNHFLNSSFVESLQRLALGLEPIDAGRRTRIAHPIEIALDKAPLGLPSIAIAFAIERHDSCLHAVRYQPGVANQVDLRFFDAARRFVPRRLRIPVLTLAAAESQAFTFRVRRPVLFPGAAYDTSETATGLRGRVLRNNQPMRWARVEATLPGNGVVVGRAHGDDRGEFLLLIDSGASTIGDLENPLPINVTVSGPGVAPSPATPDLPGLDPLWDLPLEVASAPGANDPVSAGEALPANYTATNTRLVDFTLGKLRSHAGDFVI